MTANLVPIFYDPRQSVSGVESFSPSANKPVRVVEAVQNVYDEANVMPVVPIEREQLMIAHKREYVDGVFAGRIPNGFENVDPRVPESCLWTIGSLETAARWAMENNKAACSPTSGFHHAGFSDGGGYCTFNGLAVVARKLAIDGNKVAILDLDYHYGDGTADILRIFPGDKILHFTSGKHFHATERDGDVTLEFFDWLREATSEINAFEPDVVLYQAGADMHCADPLGGFLNDYELLRRDRIAMHVIRAPIVFNLAGGYRKAKEGIDPVIKTHLNTLSVANERARARLENHDSFTVQTYPPMPWLDPK